MLSPNLICVGGLKNTLLAVLVLLRLCNLCDLLFLLLPLGTLPIP